MGMDVYGKDGSYFRANIWSWRAIHSLIEKLGADLTDKETLMLMNHNCGAGLDNKSSKTLASRLNAWLEHNVGGHMHTASPEDLSRVSDMMKQIVSIMEKEAKESGKDFDIEKVGLKAPDEQGFFVSDEHLREFVDFLNKCEGFQVH